MRLRIPSNVKKNRFRYTQATALTLLALMFTMALTASAAGQQSKKREADLSRLVFVGDSLLAGMQNLSLMANQQVHGVAPLIADQAKVPISLPLIAAPGFPNALTLIDPGPPPVIALLPGVSTGRIDPFMQATNLAVPGASVFDVLETRPDLPIDSLTDLVLGFPGLGLPQPLSMSQVEWAEALQPTTIILWIGANDALGAVLAANPLALTPPTIFDAEYHELMGRLSATGATLVVANVPDVTAIPFLTPAEDVATLVGLPLGVIGPILGIEPGDFVTYYALAQIPGILANPASGPLAPDLVLTSAEAATIQAVVEHFNATIAQEAAAHGAAMVDTAKLFAEFKKSGFVSGGQRLTLDYLGGLISLDFVHPTNTCWAIIANEFIKTLNTNFATGIPPVNVRQVEKNDPLVLPGVGHPAAALKSTSESGLENLKKIFVR